MEKEESEISLVEKINNFLVSMQHVDVKSKLIFYRLLSTMTNAGMSLVKSIIVLEAQERNPVLKKILGVFIKELQGGKNLSECLEMYPQSFSEAEVGVISSGEKTGKLNTVLLDLANQIEKMASIAGKLKSAMIYPAFIMIVVIGVIAIMMIMVVPKLLDIFDDKSALPASTQILIGVSDFLSAYWLGIVIFFFIVYVGIKIWKKLHDENTCMIYVYLKFQYLVQGCKN